MASLTGQPIQSSYQGVIKTTDNAAIGATEKRVTDGLGNASNMTIGTTGVSFDSGTVDFTGSTVTGLPGGAAGLVSGAGADSMRSADDLTTTPAAAAGADSIALGDSSSASRSNSVAIGANAHADGSGSDGSIAIGKNASAAANKAIAIGVNGTTNSAEGIAIGDNVDISSGADRVIAIGNAINVTNTTADDSIVIGTQTASSGRRGIALGFDASATAEDAVAIGYQVTAAKQDTVSVQATDDGPGQVLEELGAQRHQVWERGAANADDAAPAGGTYRGAAQGRCSESMGRDEPVAGSEVRLLRDQQRKLKDTELTTAWDDFNGPDECDYHVHFENADCDNYLEVTDEAQRMARKMFSWLYEGMEPYGIVGEAVGNAGALDNLLHAVACAAFHAGDVDWDKVEASWDGELKKPQPETEA